MTETVTLERGRSLTKLFLERRTTELAAQLSPAFLKRVGGADALAKLATEFQAAAGKEIFVEQERVYLSRGGLNYFRVSRFEKLPSVTTGWAWSNGLVTGGLPPAPSKQPAATRHLEYQTKATLRLPFGRPAKLGYWYVNEGGPDLLANYHIFDPQQRFAYDFVVMRGGYTFGTDGTRNEDHFCWNEPIYAPAAGRVVHAVGNLPDNQPGKSQGSGPGNHVVIDHGTGEFSLIAHFRQGTLAVKEGARLHAGALIGRCGNSGRSSAPHVHYHVQDGSDYKKNVGLPPYFNDYFSGGRYVVRGLPERGELLLPEPPASR